MLFVVYFLSFLNGDIKYVLLDVIFEPCMRLSPAAFTCGCDSGCGCGSGFGSVLCVCCAAAAAAQI